MYKKVLVAIDGSEPSNNALDHAVEIATKFKAKLTMIAVIQRVMIPIFPDEGFGGVPLSAAKDMAQYQDKMRLVYQNVLEEAQAKIKEEHPDLEVEAILKEGRPSAIITDYAENDGVDLIVMGSRGIGGYTGWILGSTSRKVVDSCTRPILIVK
ncbi:universal stress protein [Candidatus Bathyarchaeota archaeon]|nr:universal stress protein [Candidatus Bathyarchaeota archaeon]MBL7079288.1 universal stress protein [Candidatus Bathyarchaeota archaeon]